MFRGNRDTLLDPESLRALKTSSDNSHFLTGQFYLEVTDIVVPPEKIGFPASTKRTWTSIAANPPGRLALERYAIQLAEADALTLGDGGNGYSFGAPVVREFMETFRRLPAQPFSDRADATDPVAVRSLVVEDAFLVYAVNRERYAIRVDISLSNARHPVRMSDNIPLQLRGGHLSLELKPYELIGVRAERSARIDAVRTEVPVEQTRQIERQIAAVERAGRIRPIQRLLQVGMSDQDYRLLKAAAAEARKAFALGHLWRARSVLEHGALLAVYRKLGCFPPGMLNSMPNAADCDD
jgi:hypothetical protein